MEQNRKLVNVTATLWTDPNKIQDSVMNITVESFFRLEDLKIYVKVVLPDNDNMKILNSVLDAKKLLNGVRGNFLAKTMMENLMKSADFELKFPFKKVKAELFQRL